MMNQQSSLSNLHNPNLAVAAYARSGNCYEFCWLQGRRNLTVGDVGGVTRGIDL